MVRGVTNQLKERGVSNVEYILVAEERPTENGDGTLRQDRACLPRRQPRLRARRRHYRDYTAKYIMSKVKPGGMLIIDNINWYLPCQSKAPATRPAELGPSTSTLGRDLAGARRVAHDLDEHGVWDTAIFFRPSD